MIRSDGRNIDQSAGPGWACTPVYRIAAADAWHHAPAGRLRRSRVSIRAAVKVVAATRPRVKGGGHHGG